MRRILGAWPRKTAFALLIAAWSGSARPEVTLDGSLGGPSGSLPGPDFQIGANVGRQVGSNLFHSFSAFNLNASERAIFNDVGAVSLVENILSRVTGGSASNIDGMLRTDFANATPNLFLLNRAGVVFGPHASLDVQGSFHVSTADFIELADGVRFDALPSPNDTLLTAAPPAAFGFLREQPAAIAFRGNGSGSEFAVPEDETLSVIGGDVEITGAAMLKAPGGRINLASLASAGKVKLGNAALEAESSGPLGTITMQQDSTLDVSERQGGTTGGGSVFIRAGNFVVDDSKILANTVNGNSEGIDIELTEAMRVTNGSSFEARTSGPGKGGDVDIQAKEILLEGGSKLDACSDSASRECSDSAGTDEDFCGNCGDAGNIAIKTGRLQLTGGSEINSGTRGPGNAGNVTIKATEEVLFADDSKVRAEARFRPGRLRILGDAGSIVINTVRLELNRGPDISVLTSGDGKGGMVKITAKEVILKGRGSEQDDPSALSATTDTGSGEGGEITINTDRLSLADGATIRALTNGPGNGGNMTIEANDIVLEGESNLRVEAGPFASGDAGDLSIKTGRLQVTGGSRIEAGTEGPGKGGNVTIRARDIVLEGESKLDAVAGPDDSRQFCLDCGDGGNITIQTGRLQVREGSEIRAISRSPGKAGNVTIEAEQIVLANGVRRPNGNVIESSVLATGQARGGDAGNIVIKAGRLELNDLAVISVAGKRGNVEIQADDILVQGSFVSAASRGSGPPGSITITTDLLSLTQRGVINVGTGAPSDGGNLTINASELRLSDRSNIRAETSGSGSGGKIEITAGNIELRDGSRISSQSTSALPNAGRSGEIFIRALDSLRLVNDSQISVETARANAGDINLDVGFLLHLRDNSSITTSVAGGAGNGGNIRIDPVFTILDSTSRIVARAREGAGGNIRIVTDFFFGPRENISASSELGIDGVVEIESPDTDLNAGLIELPADFFDAATLLTQGCAAGAELSRLVVRRYEVLPDSPAALRVPPPGGLLSADAQGGGFGLTRETLGPGFEHWSACDGDG